MSNHDEKIDVDVQKLLGKTQINLRTLATCGGKIKEVCVDRLLFG